MKAFGWAAAGLVAGMLLSSTLLRENRVVSVSGPQPTPIEQPKADPTGRASTAQKQAPDVSEPTVPAKPRSPSATVEAAASGEAKVAVAASASQTKDIAGLVEADKAAGLLGNDAVAGREAFVSVERLNLRSGPGTKFAIISSHQMGSRLAVVGEDTNGWTKVSVNRSTGFVSSRFISEKAPSAASGVAPNNTASGKQRQVSAPSLPEIGIAKNEIIRSSMASYPGSCPCPFSTNRAGRRCGGSSAWSKPGGYSPVCYESDVTQAMLDTYFARLRFAGD